MKKILTMCLITTIFCSCSSIKKVADTILLSDTGVDNPATENIDESISVNPIIEGAEPIANAFPFGGAAYSVVASLAYVYAQLRKNKYKKGLKAAAVGVQSLLESDIGQEGIQKVKKAINKKAVEMNVEKELNKIVRDIS